MGDAAVDHEKYRSIRDFTKTYDLTGAELGRAPDRELERDPNPWRIAHKNAEEALRITQHDRNEKNGDPEDNFAHIALGWTGALRARGLLLPGAALNEADVARLMVILKMMRDAHAPHRDNRVDTHGYTLCLDRAEPVE